MYSILLTINARSNDTLISMSSNYVTIIFGGRLLIRIGRFPIVIKKNNKYPRKIVCVSTNFMFSSRIERDFDDYYI